MELFLLYAMGLTVVAFFSIVMASPKVMPIAQQGSDNEPAILKPNQSSESYNEPGQESVSTTITEAENSSSSPLSEEDDVQPN